jgi:SAM-dependent methyltransferase/uncharacterized protein YbaR (Trm112 family)
MTLNHSITEQPNDDSFYACPECRGRLVSDAPVSDAPVSDALSNSGALSSSRTFSCQTCNVQFPLIGDHIPILVANPSSFVSGARQQLEQEASQHELTGNYYLQAAASAGIREETLRDLSSGLLHNGQLLTQLKESLPAVVADIEQHRIALGADLFSAMRKDWSGTDETEREVSVATQAILDTLHEIQPTSTLVLGAGAGRTLCEIDAKFPVAVGIDLSATLAAAFQRLQADGQITAYQLHQGNFLRAEDECESILARREIALGNPRYVVADAAQLPFRDDTFDAVVSNYFTDMLALSQWLPEAGRVLKPGGQLIHFGPLGYVFPQIAEQYAVDQLPAAFAQHGFEMDTPKIVRSSFYGSSGRLNKFDMDNLLFVAHLVASPE